MKHPSNTIYLFGILCLIIGVMAFFGILNEQNYAASFSIFIFAGISFVLGYMLKKNLSIIILAIYSLLLIAELLYLWFSEDKFRFTPVPIMICLFIIYTVFQEYRSVKKAKEQI